MAGIDGGGDENSTNGTVGIVPGSIELPLADDVIEPDMAGSDGDEHLVPDDESIVKAAMAGIDGDVTNIESIGLDDVLKPGDETKVDDDDVAKPGDETKVDDDDVAKPDDQMKVGKPDDEIKPDDHIDLDDVKKLDDVVKPNDEIKPDDVSLQGVRVLHLANCTVHIVGTAHVSEESCKQVRLVIQSVRPEAVFLELCRARQSILNPPDVEGASFSDMLALWKKNDFMVLFAWFMHKVAKKLEVSPGGEFKAAYDEALLHGSSVFLGDRPVEITMKRMWARLTLWEKIRFSYSLLVQGSFLPNREELHKQLEQLKDKDMVTYLVQELGQAFPSIVETLLTERDLYMTAMLQRVAEEHDSIVAVVGMGHVSGIMANGDKQIEIDSLLEVPKKSSKKKFIFGAFVVGGLVVGARLYINRRSS